MPTRSPFPGMDPWLESHWGNVHLRLISEIQRQIAPKLPADLFVVVEEMVYLIGEDEDGRQFRPDVAMFQDGKTSSTSTSGTATLEVEPIRIMMIDEPTTEGFIEIRRFDEDHSLVTVIEVLSPTNKSTSEGRTAYLRKRKAYHDARVNLVEIDLLRGGQSIMSAAVENRIRTTPRLSTSYRCLVRKREEGVPVIYLYPLPLRQRLGPIRIPLRPGQADITVDLQQPIDMAYELGSYGRWIDYSRPPEPPLSAEDAEWAASLINAR